MTQTTFRTTSDSADERICIPLGVVRFVRAGFRRYRIDELLSRFKSNGVPFSKTIENLCINCLLGDYSMNDWDQKMEHSPLRKAYFCGEWDIRRWTLQRDLERLGNYLEEVTDHFTKVSRRIYEDLPTHVHVDGSHVKRNGGKGENVSYGEGGGTIQLQDQFVVAANVFTRTPVAIELYPGNQNDPQQYNDFIPQLLFHLKQGSMIIIDNGGSNADLLEEIVTWGDDYLTRVKMNLSDERMLVNSRDHFLYVGMDAACLMHTFESSNRTIYRYFSADSYVASVFRAERAVALKEQQRKRAQTIIRSKDPSRFVKVESNPFVQLNVGNVEVVVTDDPWVELDYDKELNAAVSPVDGWFKLECSLPLDPRLALLIYRHRVDIEHIISSIKSVLNLDPMRVWSKGSSRGKLALALILQFFISSALQEMIPQEVTRWIDGKPRTVKKQISSKTFISELNEYKGILSCYEWGGFRVEDLKDPGTADSIIPVIEKWEKEPPVDIPVGLSWMSLPPAQWSVKEKNFKYLATSIAQLFENNIFPQYFKDCNFWKDVKPVDLHQNSWQFYASRHPFGSQNLRRTTGYYRIKRQFR